MSLRYPRTRIAQSPPVTVTYRRVGGAIWTTGTVFNLVAANFTGVAISYAIGQSAPMVAALWGVLVWKEFAGANKLAKAFLAMMFIFYILAILLIARANTAS